MCLKVLGTMSNPHRRCGPALLHPPASVSLVPSQHQHAPAAKEMGDKIVVITTETKQKQVQ